MKNRESLVDIPCTGCPEAIMAEPAHDYTTDDWLHERRRRMALLREPIDFQRERLERLKERAKDTRNP